MKKAKPEPRMEYTPNPEVLRQQLQNAKDLIAVLDAQVRAYGGAPKQHEDQLDLAEQVAKALTLADEVSEPIHSYSYDPTGRHESDTTALPSPGAGTWFPRKHSNRLRTTIKNALAKFGEAYEHDWHPPTPPRPPSTRCGNRECEAYDCRVDAWRIARGKTISHQFCEACGRPLPAPAKEVA